MFLNQQGAQATAGISEGLDWLSTFLSLMERFGVMAVAVAIFGWLLGGFIFDLKQAKLVPRELYQQAIDERDEYRKQLEEQTQINNKQAERMDERTDKVIIPLIEILSKLKKEEPSPLSSNDREVT